MSSHSLDSSVGGAFVSIFIMPPLREGLRGDFSVPFKINYPESGYDTKTINLKHTRNTHSGHTTKPRSCSSVSEWRHWMYTLEMKEQVSPGTNVQVS